MLVKPVLFERCFCFLASIWLFAQHHLHLLMFQLCELWANGSKEFRLLKCNVSISKVLFFHVSIFFLLSAFVGTLCGILTKIHLLYVELISYAFNIKYQLMESILEVATLLSIPCVSTLTGDNWMSLLTSLMVSVAIGFLFTIASTSTSNICNDLLSKFIPSV